MTIKPLGPKVAERVPPGQNATDYTATPYKLKLVLDWFGNDLERMDFPGKTAPDNWRTVATSERDGRTFQTLLEGGTDAAVEVSYVVTNGKQSDFQGRVLPPETAYELAMDGDEDSIRRGFTIHNARHPQS